MYSDQHALNKWGFLYIQFRASAYYFIVPVLIHTFLKAVFIAFAQGSGVTQAVGLIVIEVAALIATSVLRPYMDKSTNAINVTICVINFLNAIFLLIFTDVFDGPGLMTGVVGILLWILNAAVTLILLLILIITTTIVFFKTNPDNRYQLADDRTSFMRSGSVLNTTQQLDALAAAARGDMNEGGYHKKPRLDDDEDEESSALGGSSTSDLPEHRGVPVGHHSRHSGSSLAPTEELNEKEHTTDHPSPPSTTDSLPTSINRTALPVSPLAGASNSSSDNGVEAHRAANSSRYVIRKLSFVILWLTMNPNSPWQNGNGYDGRT